MYCRIVLLSHPAERVVRPQISQPSLSLETPTGALYRLDESLFERMMFPSTPGVLPLPTSQLNLQRRMHPEIADIMRVTLYPGLQVCSLLDLGRITLTSRFTFIL